MECVSGQDAVFSFPAANPYLPYQLLSPQRLQEARRRRSALKPTVLSLADLNESEVVLQAKESFRWWPHAVEARLQGVAHPNSNFESSHHSRPPRNNMTMHYYDRPSASSNLVGRRAFGTVRRANNDFCFRNKNDCLDSAQQFRCNRKVVGCFT